jgi:hypothetical protein
MAHQLQQLLDEHKQSLGSGLYKELSDANMTKHYSEDEQVWVDVTYVYCTLSSIVGMNEHYILTNTGTTPIRTSSKILQEELPLRMNVRDKWWSSNKCQCCERYPIHVGDLNKLLEDKLIHECEDCAFHNYTKIIQPSVTVVKVKQIQ